MRLRWILSGYVLSYVTMLFLGQSASLHYAEQSWRLGLGASVTIAICLIPLWVPRFYWPIGPALIVISAVHLASGARSVAVLVAIAGICATFAAFAKRPGSPPGLRPLRLAAFALLGVASVVGAYQAAKWATEQNMFPNEVQEKMEAQFSNPYGILAAGRPDTVAALYGITKAPLLGFGSTNVDPDVYGFYRNLADSTYLYRDDYDALAERGWSREWTLATPSHSHVFGAWVDAGAVAALSWAVYLGLAVYLIQRTMAWHHPVQPLIVLVSLLVVWDTLFSPGPIRMDVAIRLSILIYGSELLRTFDATAMPERPSVSRSL